MMTRRPALRLAGLGLLLWGACLVSAQAGAPVQPYRVGQWPEIMARHQGRPFIVHLWGITCGPCLAELPQWGKFVARHPDIPVVFIEMDQAPLPVVLRYVSDSRLTQSEHRVLVDPFDEYVRYEIDPTWRGELPLTLLFSPDGKRQRVSGEFDFPGADAWAGKWTSGGG